MNAFVVVVVDVFSDRGITIPFRRPAFQSRRLTDISNVASRAADLLRSIKDFTPEEVVVHVAVVAVGGGGTNIRLPIHGAIEAAAILLDKISGGMDRMTDRQDECSAVDEKMERDLLSCTALASYGADMSRVLDLAQRRLDSLGQSSEANGLGWSSSFSDLCSSDQEIRSAY
jgi:hypothetical protein